MKILELNKINFTIKITGGLMKNYKARIPVASPKGINNSYVYCTIPYERELLSHLTVFMGNNTFKNAILV